MLQVTIEQILLWREKFRRPNDTSKLISTNRIVFRLLPAVCRVMQTVSLLFILWHIISGLKCSKNIWKSQYVEFLMIRFGKYE